MFDLIIGFINFIILVFGNTLTIIVNLLPSSPFQIVDNSTVIQYLSGFNWVFPISAILGIFQAWLVCIATFYIYSIVLRWIKAIK